MISVRSPSGVSRWALMVVAALHLAAVVTVPFTHRHLPPGGGDVASSGVQGKSSDSDSQPGHAGDFCTICQTLASAQVTPAATEGLSLPAVADLSASVESANIAPVRASPTSQPRAPPRA